MMISSVNTSMMVRGLIKHDLCQEEFWSLSDISSDSIGNIIFTLTWKPSITTFNYISRQYNLYKRYFYNKQPSYIPFHFHLFRWFTVHGPNAGRHHIRHCNTTIDEEHKSFILTYQNYHDVVHCGNIALTKHILVAQRVFIELRIPFFAGLIKTHGSGRWNRRRNRNPEDYGSRAYPLFQKFVVKGYVSSARGLYNRLPGSTYEDRQLAPLSCSFVPKASYKQRNRGQYIINLLSGDEKPKQFKIEGKVWSEFIQKNQHFGFHVGSDDRITSDQGFYLKDCSNRDEYVLATTPLYPNHTYIFEEVILD